MQTKLIAVIGSGEENDIDCLAKAKRVGQLIAERNCVLLTGGLGGVMAAASEGAAEKGGIVVGLLPGVSANDANEHVGIAIATGLREARNVIIATAADGLIAVTGEYGTLSEIALALRLSKPVIILSSPWDIIKGTLKAESPEEAIDRLFESLHM